MQLQTDIYVFGILCILCLSKRHNVKIQITNLPGVIARLRSRTPESRRVTLEMTKASGVMLNLLAKSRQRSIFLLLSGQKKKKKGDPVDLNEKKVLEKES